MKKHTLLHYYVNSLDFIFHTQNTTSHSTTTSSSPIKPPLPEDPLEEYRWGENMMLVGDTFWRSFLR